MSSGNVTRRNDCNGVAPSIRAASYSSAGSASRAAYRIMKVNGRCSHTLSRQTSASPATGLAAQSASIGIACASGPTSVSNKNRQMTTADTSLTAYGPSTTASITGRNGTPEANSSAINSPSTSSTCTTTSTTMAVLPIARQKYGSASTRA